MSVSLYQLELDQSYADCGMSYVFTLSDGRFFIIDGGYFCPGEDDRLYRFLRSHAQGELVVAGWYFTHGHDDHIGNFIQFVERYGDAVEIQNVYYNFQPIDFTGASDNYRADAAATIQYFYRLIERRGFPVHILHTGERFTAGDLEIEVLYTQEELYPIEASFNDYSTVITTSFGGQKILWLGDIGDKASAILMKRPEKLRCDLVQVAHHGFNGAPTALYAATGAKVALWPTADYRFIGPENQTRDANDFLLHRMGIEEHIISGHGTAMLPLPYTPKTAVRFPKELFTYGAINKLP